MQNEFSFKSVGATTTTAPTQSRSYKSPKYIFMKTNHWYKSTSFFQSIVPAKFGHSIVVSEGGILLIDRNWSTYINYWSVGEQGIFKVNVHLVCY